MCGQSVEQAAQRSGGIITPGLNVQKASVCGLWEYAWVGSVVLLIYWEV